MSVSDTVRSRISTVELALKDAGADNTLNAIVDALKAIATALDDVEHKIKRATK